MASYSAAALSTVLSIAEANMPAMMALVDMSDEDWEDQGEEKREGVGYSQAQCERYL
jgi:hypothetical protein